MGFCESDVKEIGVRYLNLLRDVASNDIELAAKAFRFPKGRALLCLTRLDDDTINEVATIASVPHSYHAEGAFFRALSLVRGEEESSCDAFLGDFTDRAIEWQTDWLLTLRQIARQSRHVAEGLCGIRDVALLDQLARLELQSVHQVAQHSIFLSVTSSVGTMALFTIAMSRSRPTQQSMVALALASITLSPYLPNEACTRA